MCTRQSVSSYPKLPQYHEAAQRASYPCPVPAQSPACSWPCLVPADVPSALPSAPAPMKRGLVAVRTEVPTPRRCSQGCAVLETLFGNRTARSSPPAMDESTTEVPHRARCSGICFVVQTRRRRACAAAAHTCAACIACNCSCAGVSDAMPACCCCMCICFCMIITICCICSINNTPLSALTENHSCTAQGDTNCIAHLPGPFNNTMGNGLAQRHRSNSLCLADLQLLLVYLGHRCSVQPENDYKRDCLASVCSIKRYRACMGCRYSLSQHMIGSQSGTDEWP